MKILHLGFEDHRRPGAGGGSGRNQEVNRRLATHHEVTVVTAAYPGCSSRMEEGVRYRHVGVGGGYAPSLLSYFAALPMVVARARRERSCDLIVEEYAPPSSTLGVAAWSGMPTCANVQWFFAAAKAREYRLPGWTMEAMQRWGTRRHTHVVALSHDLATQIQAVNPQAEIIVNGMGVAVPDLGPAVSPVPGSSVFLGRLDVDHKGIDLLLEALAIMPADATELTLVGEGRGRRQVEEQIRRLELGDRVHLAGDVRGVSKWRMLAGAQVVVMPSRWETFGLSALEALAVGRPVMAFDIPCLRDVVTNQRGVLVKPFDVREFAESWGRLLNEPDRCNALGASGARFARSQSWDDVAQRQEAFYAHCVSSWAGRTEQDGRTDHELAV
jgi:glycogen synthase